MNAAALVAALGLLSPPGGGRPRRAYVGDEPDAALDGLHPPGAHGGRPLPQSGALWAAFGALHGKWFTQRVDHFDRGNSSATFEQKYFIDDSHYDGTGPVLLYINGEAPLYAAPGGDSFTGALARRLNGLVVALEHRYYGDSQPFADVSTSSLRYLSTAQAFPPTEPLD